MVIKKYSKYLDSLAMKGSPFYLSKEILKDLLNIRNKIKSNEKHIKAAVNWLLTAQQANNDGGVAALYSLYEGWHASYSETTGYIIPTMFNYYHETKDEKIRQSAVRMADWELTKQMPDGAFPGAANGNKELPIVFNTGQVIFGMAMAYQETKNEKYKKSAVKAADWLAGIQNKDGCWDKCTYLNQVHTYNTRTAWSLLKVHKITKKEIYKKAAVKNIEWALKQQLGNGQFMHNAFHENQEPLLHTIAYAIRGILEAGIYLKNKVYISAAKKPADVLLKKQRKDGSLPGSFDKNWNSSVSWSCLTGNSQTSIIWQKLYSITKNKGYLIAAKKINAYMKSTQDIHSGNKSIRGAIKGAYPIYGWYAPFSFPNWAAKFFIDSLMLESDSSIADKLC
ncbi:terpene cyclase/mutase family protein [Candidatus Woesearchaeota archaeon]|nr:terpene cyclase/mutase family protein [Candidatus Woesearchaeota archaeon]